jgi:hypothetical protein
MRSVYESTAARENTATAHHAAAGLGQGRSLLIG